jgi:hypothetical protein
VLQLATSISIPKAAAGDAGRKREAIDEIVVLEREVMFVLDRSDAGLLYDLLESSSEVEKLEVGFLLACCPPH